MGNEFLTTKSHLKMAAHCHCGPLTGEGSNLFIRILSLTAFSPISHHIMHIMIVSCQTIWVVPHGFNIQ